MKQEESSSQKFIELSQITEKKIDSLELKLEYLLEKTNNNLQIISENTEKINTLTDKTGKTEQSLTYLSYTFDVWQNNVEPLLAAAQSAMTYDNVLLTATAIIIAIVAIWFQGYATRSKEQAIREAIGAVESTIAKGILPSNSEIRSKVIDSILNSEEFVKAVKEVVTFIEKSENADEAAAKRGDKFEKSTTSTVTLDVINDAKDAQEENGSTENNGTDDAYNNSEEKINE